MADDAMYEVKNTTRDGVCAAGQGRLVTPEFILGQGAAPDFHRQAPFHAAPSLIHPEAHARLKPRVAA